MESLGDIISVLSAAASAGNTRLRLIASVESAGALWRLGGTLKRYTYMATGKGKGKGAWATKVGEVGEDGQGPVLGGLLFAAEDCE